MVYENNNDGTFNVDDLPAMEVVEATELHELTLEQVLETPSILDRNTRAPIKFADFTEDGMLSDMLGFVAAHTDGLNYTTTATTSLVHGLAIFEFENQECISDLLEIRSDNLVTRREMYRRWHRNVRPFVDFGKCDMMAWCDPETKDRIAVRAKNFNMPMSQLATGLILLSIVTSTTIPSEELKHSKLLAEDFNAAINKYVNIFKDIQY